VLSIGLYDPRGIAVAHTVESERGTAIEHHPSLPRPKNLLGSFSVLWSLRRPEQMYETHTHLLAGDQPFGSIQVAIAGSFLRDRVKGAFVRGAVVAGILAGLAVLGVLVLAREVARRFQRSEAANGESLGLIDGPDALHRLARGLNLLGEQFRKRPQPDLSLGQGSIAVVDQSRLISGIGQTAAGMAHELRGTLQGLSFELDAIIAAAEGNGSSEAIQSHSRRAQQRLHHLNQAISGFVKMAQLGPSDVRAFDVKELMEEVGSVLKTDANLAGLELEVDADAASAVIMADRGVLRQAIENLIRNALQAQPSRNGKIVLRSEVDAGTVHVSVADSGPGIEPEILPKVFDPYFTTRKDGSGIGLALVRQTVEMFGGQVTIVSTPGLGAVVGMKLPVLPRR
jgi:signal transduction histidine kinase